jgi:3'-phosphoadenosine 5'-phosphosulfate sulfotransferase (PAPS reductase)/FAD synthetase
MQTARPWRLRHRLLDNPNIRPLLGCTIPPSSDGPAPVYAEPTTVIASLSGGNDGFAAALVARARWPAVRFIAWHAHIAVLDWRQTREVFLRQAEALDAEPVIHQAVYQLTGEQTATGMHKTRLFAIHDVLACGEATREEYGEDAILNLLEFGTRARRGNAPTSRLRWCTAYGKTALFNAYVRRNRADLGEQAVLISGERWAESDSRAKVPSWEWRDKVALKEDNEQWPDGWRMLWLRPTIAWRWHEVNALVHEAGIGFHPGYYWQGETNESMLDPMRPEQGRARLSCRVCIFSTPQAMARAMQSAPEAFADAVGAVDAWEQETGKTWQQRGAIRKLVQPHYAASRVRQTRIL